MKRGLEFVLTTLKGGLLVVLPLALLAVLAAKAVGALRLALTPLVRQLPADLHYPTAVAALVLIAGCFVAGLIMRSAFLAQHARALEDATLARLPGYSWLRKVSRSVMEDGTGSPFVAALVVLEDALVPAVVVERHEGGQYTVFVPSSPSATSGNVYILEPGRVHVLDVPLPMVLKSVTRWGIGASALLRALARGAR